MEEQQIRDAINVLIERKDKRITELRAQTKDELRASARLQNEVTISNLEHAVATLIELEHNLRLCGCPDEAYQGKAEEVS